MIKLILIVKLKRKIFRASITYICKMKGYFQGFFPAMAADERLDCGGPSLRRVHDDSHGVDDALRMLALLLDVAGKAARDSLRGGSHRSAIRMVLLDKYSGR